MQLAIQYKIFQCHATEKSLLENQLANYSHILGYLSIEKIVARHHCIKIHSFTINIKTKPPVLLNHQ